MLACGLFDLAVLGEFLARIGTRRFEQPIVDRGAPEICCDERLSDEVCHTVDDIRRGDLGIHGNRIAAAKVKPPAKIDSWRSTPRSDWESTS